MGQTFPTGFSRVQVGGVINNPTVMAFAPDGRIFVAEQSGKLIVIKNDEILATPFVQLTVNSSGERGLIGIAFDPDFSNNNFIYLYYTVPTTPIHNRVSRFTANGDIAVPASEQVILELDNLSGATNHNGGALAFGPDGKLYVAVGDNATGTKAQDLDNHHGKILRINKDGTAPSDNPFPTGSNQRKLVWSYGLRNPFTFSFQPGTGKLFVNDVGQNTWEEVNDATVGGRNFGWPATEGPTANPLYASPLYAYTHSTGTPWGCAITGGSFFDPVATNYPSIYAGKYYFMDFCSDWIYSIAPNETSPIPTPFGSGIGGSSLSLCTGPDGNWYYLGRTNKRLYRILFTPAPPSITSQPSSYNILTGESALFSVTTAGTEPLSYQWQKDGAGITGATQSDYEITSAQLGDAGDYRVIVSNVAGTAMSNIAVLTVAPGPAAPVIIEQPADISVESGQPALFTVTATGMLPLMYKWEKNNSDIDGATQSSYEIASAQLDDAGEYRVMVSNAVDVVTSNIATLTVTPAPFPPMITEQPADMSVVNGQPASFSVTAEGTPPLMYQWQKDNSDISGATQSTYEISDAQQADAGNYSVMVSNVVGPATSNIAVLVVTIEAVAPMITQQPADINIVRGQAALFSVTATGTSPLAYQWQKSNASIDGATLPNFEIASAELEDGGNYRVMVSNIAGTATSNVAILTVSLPLIAPSITVQPAPLNVETGQQAIFSLLATGSAPLTYQWQKENSNIPGATGAEYIIDHAQVTDGGYYKVIIANAAGSVASSSVLLTVSVPNSRPITTITLPVSDATYSAGTTLQFSGEATDPEQGILPANAFEWEINFHHGTHKHDQPPMVGIKSGTFEIPNRGETSVDVWYRIILTVNDDEGLSTSDSVDVFPRTSKLSFTTDPSGLEVTIDGQPFTAPVSVFSVEGLLRDIGVVSPGRINEVNYNFSSWSHGGLMEQTISTPGEEITFHASFAPILTVPIELMETDVYPLPASTWIYINTADILKVSLVDPVGRTYSPSVVRSGQQVAIQVDQLPTGLYLLKYETPSSSGWRKILIQR